MLNLYPPSAHIANGVKPTFPADVDAACQDIYKACKGLGTDEAKLVEVLGTKSPETRNLIALRYKDLFNKDLKTLVKSETSGDFGKLLAMIAVPLPELEADILRYATKGLGTSEEYLYPVLMGRTNVEMQILKTRFFEVYNKDLAVTMNGELSGDFKKAIMNALNCLMVDFDKQIHTPEKAEADADALYKAGQGRFGTDEDTFIGIISQCPPEHLRNVNAAYTKKYNNTLLKAVEKEFGGDARRALLFLIRMTLDPLDLLAEHFESTMKGLGTDEYGLSAAVVRYHCVLPQIKEAYKKKYQTELRDRIHGETSGDYRELLLSVFDAPTQ